MESWCFTRLRIMVDEISIFGTWQTNTGCSLSWTNCLFFLCHVYPFDMFSSRKDAMARLCPGSPLGITIIGTAAKMALCFFQEGVSKNASDPINKKNRVSGPCCFSKAWMVSMVKEGPDLTSSMLDAKNPSIPARLCSTMAYLSCAGARLEPGLCGGVAEGKKKMLVR